MPSAPITYPRTESGLRAALAALGTTPEAVAVNLGAMGFKGSQDNVSCCPVANYLYACLEGAGPVGVSWEICAAVDGSVVHVPSPAPVDGFVDSFDMGRYPNLIEEETPDA